MFFKFVCYMDSCYIVKAFTADTIEQAVETAKTLTPDGYDGMIKPIDESQYKLLVR